MPRLYDKQHAAIFDPARYCVIEASTKTGKTVGCIIWLVEKAWNEGQPESHYWWIAPVYAQAAIAYRRLKSMLSSSDPHHHSWTSNETETNVTLVNGARIWFKGADRPDTLFGEDVYAGVIDEATRCKEEAWHAIRSTVTATKAPLRIIGNVKGRKNWAYQMARRAETGDHPNMSHHKIDAYDAVAGGILDIEEIEDAKQTLPEAVFRELYLAEPSDDGHNPFGLTHIQACKTQHQPTTEATWFGVDLAKHRDFCWLVGVDDKMALTVSDRWQSDWQASTQRIVDQVQSTPCLADSTGVGDPVVEGMHRMRPNIEGFTFTPRSKQQIMEGLAVAIQHHELGLYDERLVNELESFEYEFTRTGGVRYTAPEGMNDDGVCALALCVHCRNLRPVSFGVRVIDYAPATMNEEDDDDGVW
jgi:hypothetical protein